MRHALLCLILFLTGCHHSPVSKQQDWILVEYKQSTRKFTGIDVDYHPAQYIFKHGNTTYYTKCYSVHDGWDPKSFPDQVLPIGEPLRNMYVSSGFLTYVPGDATWEYKAETQVFEILHEKMD